MAAVKIIEKRKQKGSADGRKERVHDPAEGSVQDGFLLLNRYRGALMGFAALWIYILHEWQTISGEHLRALWVETFIKRIGFCGVDIFLFLSGMGVVYSIAKSKNVFAFYGKRLKRIILPFVFVALLYYRPYGWTPAVFWQNILCINFYSKSMYAYLWFVPAILTFYLFSPLYYHFFIKSSGKIRFTLCALIIWLAGTLLVADRLRYDLFGLTNRIPVFIVGILAGWLAREGHIAFDRLTWRLLTLMFLLGLYLSYLSIYEDMYILVPLSNCCVPNLLMSVSLSFLLPRFLSALNGKKCFRLLGKGLTGLFHFFGLFTLEFYCIQEWMGDLMLPRILGRYSNLTVNVILFAAVVAAALAMYGLFKYFWIFVEWVVKKLYNVCGGNVMCNKARRRK